MAADLVTTNAQGRGFTEEQVLERGDTASSQSTDTMTPGRFFFIWIGVMNASSAPASMSLVIV